MDVQLPEVSPCVVPEHVQVGRVGLSQVLPKPRGHRGPEPQLVLPAAVAAAAAAAGLVVAAAVAPAVDSYFPTQSCLQGEVPDVCLVVFQLPARERERERD